MPKLYEFEPSDHPMDLAHRQELLADGIQPTAVLALRDAVSGLAYGVYNRRQERGAGLPTFDLDRMKAGENLETYIAFKMRKRFSIALPLADFQILQFLSNESAHIDDMRSKTPGVHQRIYIPIIGRTLSTPDNNHMELHDLRLMEDDVLMSSISSYGGDDILKQSLDVHREMLFISKGTNLQQ